MKTIILATLALALSPSVFAVPTDFPDKVPVVDNVTFAELKLGCPAGVCDGEYLRDAMVDTRKLSREQLDAFVNGSESWKGEWDYPRDSVEAYNDAMIDATGQKLDGQVQIASELNGNTYDVIITSTVPSIAIKWGTAVVDGTCKGPQYSWMYRADTSEPLYPLGKGDSITYKTTCTNINSIKVVTNLGTAIYN